MWKNQNWEERALDLVESLEQGTDLYLRHPSPVVAKALVTAFDRYKTLRQQMPEWAVLITEGTLGLNTHVVEKAKILYERGLPIDYEQLAQFVR
ncbi:MAG: hypothetical protein ACE5FT_01855 [Candidatus Nanoarchaeia archaeon]